MVVALGAYFVAGLAMVAGLVGLIIWPLSRLLEVETWPKRVAAIAYVAVVLWVIVFVVSLIFGPFR